MWFWTKDPAKDFPYDITDVTPGLEEKSIWTLHRGKKKASGDSVSVFRYDPSPGREEAIDKAKAAAKRLKTLRHPDILTFLDSHETDKSVCVVTESVVPVDQYLNSISNYTSQQKLLAISWGIHQVSKGLGFLINDCNLNHNNLFSGSVFVTPSGSWKISGFEYVTPATDSPYPSKNLSYLDKYTPPDGGSGGTKWSNDSYGLGCLIWEVFNGPLSSTAALKSPGKIPRTLHSCFNELIHANASRRLSPLDLIERCRAKDGFMKNSFIDAMLFLEEIQIKEQNAKNRFFANLDSQLDSFPIDVCKNRILPNLVTAFEYGDAGAAVLGPLFKIAKHLEDSEFQKKVVPCIVKLFASKDRATRAKLLQQSEFFVRHLQKNVVNDQVYPQIAQGFVDSNATIREQTVKAMVHFAPKLNYSNLNEDMLKHFARLQSRDEEGVIRTNTVVCLGKIACHLNPAVRQSVLIASFLRAMRDPFPPTRINGILALSATQAFFSIRETATKVMPALCHLTTDPDKSVRDHAFKALRGFMGKVEKVSEDPSLAAQMEADLNASGTEATVALGATWASWAVSSLTSKFYRSKSTSQPPDDTKDVKSPTDSATVEQTGKGTASKQASEENEVWGAMESLDDSRKESPATDGWQNDWESEELEQPSHREEGKEEEKEEEKNGWDTEEWGSAEDKVAQKEEVVAKNRKKQEDGGEKWPAGRRKPMRLGAQRLT